VILQEGWDARSSARHRSQPGGGGRDEARQALKRPVPAVQAPFAVRLDQRRSHPLGDRRVVEENARDGSFALDLGVQALQRMAAVDVQPVRLGKFQDRQPLELCAVEQGTQLGPFGAQRIGHRTPLPMRGLDTVLRDKRADGGADPPFTRSTPCRS
jgi:hypothetical protein